MLADAASTALLAPAAPPPMLADAASTALLAHAAPPPMLADAASAALLAHAAPPTMLAYHDFWFEAHARTPAATSSARRRPALTPLTGADQTTDVPDTTLSVLPWYW